MTTFLDTGDQITNALIEENKGNVEVLFLIYHCRGDHPVDFSEFGLGFPMDFVCPCCQQSVINRELRYGLASRKLKED